ncbi:Uncharacterized protein PFLU_1247 [Pseudomonas [fluorescens] SBW25]|uniref:Uncharacterized protein n=1 Tax=Pseudomonas fluorescens (strain SBW25) TaxID=216595 RepID=C3K4Q3_PSEFS|nr:Uncharacterized protein PFLU_1247 [Pseudomonas fluorescens SBW25]
MGDQRACPVVIEVQGFLLRDQFFGRVRRGGRWQQVQLEFGDGQVQWAWLRCRAWLRQRLASGQYDRAHPTAFEVLLALLGDDFFFRERCGGGWQQVGLELGDRQEQRLRRRDFGVFHVTPTLREDLRQQVGASTRFYRWVCRCRRLHRERVRRIAKLLGQCPGEEVLPHMAHPGQRLGIAQAVVVVGRQYTDG